MINRRGCEKLQIHSSFILRNNSGKKLEEIEIAKYLKPEPYRKPGRPGYNRVNMLKTVLFGFMDTGYTHP